MSGEQCDKQPGFPETETKCSLKTEPNFAKYFNSAKKFPGLGITDQWLTVTSKIQILLSSDTFKIFSVHFCSTHFPTLSMLEKLSDVQGYFRDPECEGLVYAGL
jgi:hypothetical protein